MSIIDVWGNSFVPLLAGIPLLIFILFACCACIDKTITAARTSFYYYTCRSRTPRRVRFDCETQHRRNNSSPSTSTSYSKVTRSNTSPRLSGLMAHSSYVQRNSNYRYHNSVVHVDRSAMPLQARTVLDRESLQNVTCSPKPLSRDIHPHQEPPPQTPGVNLTSVFTYQGSRRSSTPTPTGPPNSYYTMRPKSPFESCGTHLEPKQRRYSTPSSPTMYAYTQQHQSHRPEGGSNYSSVSYLPEVRAYLQFMEDDPSSRQRSHSFSGRNSSRSSSRRSSRRSSRHRPRSRSPSPYALERTAMASDDGTSNYSNTPSSYGRYLTPQGSSDQGSFRSPESGTPENWLDASDLNEHPPSYEDCLSNLSRSSSIRTSFI